MHKQHDVQRLSFENDHMYVQVDGKACTFDLADVSVRLLRASAEERMKYEISPSGYGIHWPSIDEDLSVDALLGVKHNQSESQLGSQRGASAR